MVIIVICYVVILMKVVMNIFNFVVVVFSFYIDMGEKVVI